MAAGVTKDNLGAARKLLAFAETVRGFGPVREASMRAARARLPGLRKAWKSGAPAREMEAAE